MMILTLSLLAILTASISAVAGMGGGVLLLSFMSLALPYKIIIPIHAVVQFVSNSSRAFYLRSHVNWKFFIAFLLGTPIGTFAAYKILSQVSDSKYYYLILAIFILYTLFKPKKLPSLKLNHLGWFGLGILASTMAPFLGATGPLIALFYVRDDLSKEEIISTKAIQQLVLHFIKVPLFLSLDFNYMEYMDLLLCMTAGVFIGTFLGVKILKGVDESLFRKIFKSVLFLASLRLLYKFYQL